MLRLPPREGVEAWALPTAVTVTVRGLWSDDGERFNASVHHGRRHAVLGRGERRDLRIGVAPHRPAFNATDGVFDGGRVGLDLPAVDATFADAIGENVARWGTARQSSTLYGATADRVLDGDTAGQLSRGSVAHTACGVNDPRPWIDVRLRAAGTIGAVRLHGRVRETATRVEQVVEVRASTATLGAFTLTMAGVESGPIAHDAVALRVDEVVQGESMQAKLEGMSNVNGCMW